jgi:hypothetical protein
MPVARFEMPDGRIARYEVPEGTTPEQAQSMIKGYIAQQSGAHKEAGTLGNLVAGAIRGAGSIGATILSPIDVAARTIGIKNGYIGRTDRRQAMDEGLHMMGADPNSIPYQIGKIGGEVAGTAGAGGALSQAVTKIPRLVNATQMANALRTGGLGINVPMLQRVEAGAITGGAMSGLADPETAGTGAVLGGALPIGAKIAGVVADNVAKPAARRIMQSAVKPTIEQLRKGDAQVAIDTLLDYGISPTQRGVEQIRSNIDDINSQIAGKVASSTSQINKNDVLGYLTDVNRKFANQVSPTSDLSAISGVADDFISHPLATGQTMSVPLAQQLKQGTYKALKGKYGEAGSAATEAQKALARGLKTEIGKAVPDIVPLNAEEARLLKTLNVAERRALMELNKNPVGLSALAGNPYGFAAFMADRSAAFKALTARIINQAPKAVNAAAGVAANPVVRSGLLQAWDVQ